MVRIRLITFSDLLLLVNAVQLLSYIIMSSRIFEELKDCVLLFSPIQESNRNGLFH